MRISIITINYNGSENTIELLKSLESQTDKNFEIIVVDNASEEADFKNLEKYYTTNPNLWRSALHIYRQSGNLGFSGGNNAGIRQALKNGSDWVVLLNNDTWVESDFTEHLKAFLSDRRGIVGLPLNEGDRTAYYGQIQWFKSTLGHVYSIKNQVLRENIYHPTLNTKYLILNTNQYAIGGAAAIHKNVFEKIGFLDEKYFLYFEDADFSLRAVRAKFPISTCSDCMIYHTVSTTTKKLGSPLLLRYHYRNALFFNLKNGPWYVKLLVWPWSWLNFSKQVFKIVMNREPKISKAILLGIIDFYLDKFGKIE